jgi:hypothetical protein
MPTELHDLFERYCCLGELLPSPDSFDTDDPLAVADCMMTLREMAKVQKKIAALAGKYAGT